MRSLDELGGIRSVGFAINNEEFEVGVHSMAMPVRDDTGEVIAVASIVAPTSMVSRSQLVEDFGPHLLTATDQISALLGYLNEEGRPTADGKLEEGARDM